MTEESNTNPTPPEAVEVVRTEAGLKPAFSKEDIEPVIPVDGEQQEQTQEQAEAPPPDHLPPNDGTHEVSFDDADADADARDAENDQYVDDVAEENGDEEEEDSDSDDGGACDASEVEEAPVSEEELRYTELEVLTEKIAAAKLQLAQIEEEKKAAEASHHATKADIDSAIAEADLRLRETQSKIDALQTDFDKKADAQSSIDKTEDDAENAYNNA